MCSGDCMVDKEIIEIDKLQNIYMTYSNQKSYFGVILTTQWNAHGLG